MAAITTTTTTLSKERDGNFCSIVGWSRKQLDVSPNSKLFQNFVIDVSES
jgi:hypothetical protein